MFANCNNSPHTYNVITDIKNRRRVNVINPPTDRPYETIQNLHFQKCPLVLYTHGDTIWTVLVASCTTIQMVLEGPLIHHLEVSKQGFVLVVLPFGKIQTRFLY